MHMQDKQLLFQVIPGNTLDEDVRMLGKLASVAGLVVGLQHNKEGSTFVSVGYNEEFTEFIRSRNAGRPRKRREVSPSCSDVFSLKEVAGAKAAAASLGMSLATFYRHCKDNRGKRGDEPFL